MTGLEHSAHVLEKGGKVFSATLGLVDIVKGTNSYYKLQLLEDDKESRCVLGTGQRPCGDRGASLLAESTGAARPSVGGKPPSPQTAWPPSVRPPTSGDELALHLPRLLMAPQRFPSPDPFTCT